MTLNEKQFEFLQAILRHFNSAMSTMWGPVLHEFGWTREEQIAFMTDFGVTPYQPWPPTHEEFEILKKEAYSDKRKKRTPR